MCAESAAASAAVPQFSMSIGGLDFDSSSSPVEPRDVKLESGTVSGRRTPADGSVRMRIKYEENIKMNEMQTKSRKGRASSLGIFYASRSSSPPEHEFRPSDARNPRRTIIVEGQHPIVVENRGKLGKLKLPRVLLLAEHCFKHGRGESFVAC